MVVADDGVGGATATAGSGLEGLRDRVEALGGAFTVDSPPGHGHARRRPRSRSRTPKTATRASVRRRIAAPRPSAPT